jgi:hypothetical protein
MRPIGNLLTMDQPVTYEIRVCGHVKESWSNWIGANTTVREARNAGSPVSVITGAFDQAALHGFLRRMYTLGFPLLSVNCVEPTAGARNED